MNYPELADTGSLRAEFIILSGIPRTGKSTYSQWMHTTLGFVHHDVDFQGVPEFSIHENRPLVIDWGFSAIEPGLSWSIARINDWKAVGAKLWWFDGDRVAALASFLRRGTVSQNEWDRQMDGIVNNWDRIEAAIDFRLDVISLAGYVSPELIVEQMLP